MTQQLYHSYRDPDSTSLFKEKLRTIIPSGVYSGYTVSKGTGNWDLTFTHDVDPDNTGSILGVLATREGVTCHENANQVDVCTGFAPGGLLDETHYVIAEYTYNASLPANVVNYYVVVAPHVLTDREVLIAEIYVPAAAGNYNAAGVVIKNVKRQTLVGDNESSILEFVNILKPGIYSGMEISEGTDQSEVNLALGTWVTKENWKIDRVASADLSVALPAEVLADPGPTNYRFVWVIGAHKYEETNPIPTADYFLVAGGAVGEGSEASLPNDAAILAAATAIDPKYTSDNHWNKLGYLRVYTPAGGTLIPDAIIDYYKGNSILDNDTLIVYGADASSHDMRSGGYYGHQGLLQAIDDVYTILTANPDVTTSDRLEKPYTIQLDGSFKLADMPLYLPSCVKLQGIGSPSVLKSETLTALKDDVVRAQGYHLSWDGLNNTITIAAIATIPVLAGYNRFSISINALGAYRNGDDLVEHLFVPGDRVRIYDNIGIGTYYSGIFHSYDTGVDNWKINCYVDGAFGIGDTISDMMIFKRQVWLENIEIDNLVAADGTLVFSYLDDSGLSKIKCRDYQTDYIYNCSIESLEITNLISWGLLGFGDNTDNSTGNKYGTLRLTTPVTPSTIGFTEKECIINCIEYVNTSVVMVLNLYFEDSNISFIRLEGNAGTKVALKSGAINIDTIIGDVDIDVNTIRVGLVKGTIVNNTGGSAYRVLTTDTYDGENEFLEKVNEDKNLRVVSSGNIAWNKDVNELSWTDDIYFDLAFQTGYNILAGPSFVSLTANGDRAYIELVRNTAGNPPVITSVITKAGAATTRRDSDSVLFALRQNDVITLIDGTTIEHGQSLKFGQTPTPDGSVTYPKLANSLSTTTANMSFDSDPLSFHRKFFRDYVIPESNNTWLNEVVALNSTPDAVAYVAATGVVTYAGGAGTIDLSNVVVGDTLILKDAAGIGGRESILAVDDLAKTVTIAKGLNPGALAVHKWNGSIVKGNIAFVNDTGVALTYVENTGVVTSPGFTFSASQVRPGYLLLDGSGNAYKIRAVVAATSVTIAPRLRNFNGVVSDPMHGAIVTDNNPSNKYFSDFKILAGQEFIPIDGISYTDDLKNTWNHENGEITSPFSKLGAVRQTTIPYDSRIRVYTVPGLHSVDGADINPVGGFSHPLVNATIVEFTGVCTGLAIAITGGIGSSLYKVEVDGADIDWLSNFIESKTMINTYGTEQNRYELLTSGLMRRLPQGIHTIRISFRSFADDTVGYVPVRGIMVTNCPINIVNDLDFITFSGGVAAMNGGILSKSNNSNEQVLPTMDTLSYPKGGRLVNYISDSGDISRAITEVYKITDSGDALNGNPTITNVGDTTRFRVGDLLEVIGLTSATVELHIITVIPVLGSITMEGNWNGLNESVTIRLYGSSFFGSHDRDYEEVAASFLISEFAATGPLGANRSIAGLHNDERAVIGVRLSDCNTCLAATDIRLDDAEGIAVKLEGDNVADNGNYIRIHFVGTGLSMQAILPTAANFTIDVEVDGITCGSLPQYGFVTGPADDPGGIYICGNLPYGNHIVKLFIQNYVGGDSFWLRSLTIWQPRKPTFSGLELMDTNICADSPLAHLYGNTGVEVNHYGMIQYEASRLASPDTTNQCFQDISDVVNVSTQHRSCDFSGGVGAAVNDEVHYTFFGREFILVTNNIVDGGVPIEVYIMDNDGTYEVPSLLVGFGVTGPDVLIPSGIDGIRHTWVFDQIGLHTIQFKLKHAASFLVMDCIEIWTPFHTHKTKQPVYLDHFVPFQGVIDKRNLIPFRSDLVPSSNYQHTHGIWYGDTVGGDTEDNQEPFWFYTKGGLVEIELTLHLIVGAAPGKTIDIVIDCMNETTPISSIFNTAAVAGVDSATVSCRRSVYLDAGYHFASFAMGVGSNDTFQYAQWKARTVSNKEFQLASRSQSIPLLGPVNDGESSY